MSRLPRVSKKGPPDYLSKLDPWFVELARLFRDDAKASRPGPKHRDSLKRTADRRSLLGSRGRPPVVALPEWPRTIGEMYDVLSQLPDARFTQAISAIKGQTPEEALEVELNEALLNMLSLVKYQTTFAELQWRERQGDWKAARQIVEVEHLRNLWLHEQLPPGGVRFKTNPRHNLLMLYGLAGGLERLTSSELVHFFDEMCPCGEMHNQQVLQRLRTKLQKSLAGAQFLTAT